MKAIIFVLIFSLTSLLAQAQSAKLLPGFGEEVRADKGIRIAFYNLENLFDIKDDSLTRDEEFTPEGAKRWNWFRYQDKVAKHAKTLTAVGGWEAPALIAVCEIENEYVLKSLTEFSLLKPYRYQIIHQDSPDLRGIDVGLLFRPDKFDVLHFEALPVVFEEADSRPTRDILYVMGSVLGQDSLHVFVNHWPSRYGGMMSSEPKRLQAARVLRQKVEEIFAQNPQANIVITGDFNDEPENKSLSQVLAAKHKEEELQAGELFNLMHEKVGREGSHKFAGEWGILDHFIVSSALMKGSANMQITQDRAQIFRAPWLLKPDTRDMGEHPFRTYQGPKYLGGYSDHLPIYLDLIMLDKQKPRPEAY